MVQPNHSHVSVVRQCSLLKISRSGLYYQLAGEPLLNLSLMSEINRIFVEHPFWDLGKCVII